MKGKQKMLLLLPVLIWLLPGGCGPRGGGNTHRPGYDREARMRWWREAKFGMFIHWGLYSIPAGYWKGEKYTGAAEWLMNKARIPVSEYEKLAAQFNPVKYDPDSWVKLARDAGMKYIVITSKHHEGFCLWDSKQTDYDVVDATPYKKDLLLPLARACRRYGMKLGFYYSILDWHHPDYLPRRPWDSRPTTRADFNRYIDYMKAQLGELLSRYEDLAVIWFDGGWEHSPETLRAKEVVQYLHSLKPDLIINNRIGLPMDFATPEQHIPKEKIPGRDWETCMTMNDTWGYHRDDNNWKTSQDLIRKLIDIASKGGNFLLNVGPTSEGLIPEASIHLLQEIGKWMKTNGESIYGTEASPFRETPWGRCTMKKKWRSKTVLYLHVFSWPEGGLLKVPGLGSDPMKIYSLQQKEKSLFYKRDNQGILIDASSVAPDQDATVLALEFRGEVITYHPPTIKAPANIFVHSLPVELQTPTSQLDIHFTLDGSDPTEESERYFQPLTITREVTLKAQSYYEGKPVSEIVQATFQKVTPKPAVTTGKLAPGLRYEYYEGEWDSLPDFNRLAPVATGVSTAINLEKRKREEKFGLRFSGYFQVPEDEVYLFALNSDDGSRLFVDDIQVIDNDGLHGARVKTGQMALAAGKHKISLLYFNNPGGKRLSFTIGQIGHENHELKPEQLYHEVPSK